ncbi:hypothetical protein [Streptomyces sp. NPDC046727]|uniref:hypothetical protein n=1 Tax=Streptomyces sp. NPDC046727 TaxID=3155373 RepID=UPI0033F3985D
MITESVNPLSVTRDAWRDTAAGTGVRVVGVEVVCSDPAEHQLRVTSRSTHIPGLPLPDRQQVVDREHVIVDTAGQSPQQSVALLLRGLAAG